MSDERDETNAGGSTVPPEEGPGATYEEEDASEPTPTILYVNAYAVSRHYGGPEEGGWWYDSGRVLASVPISADASDADVATIRKALTGLLGWPKDPPSQGRYSVIGGSDFEVYVEDHVGREWPEETPHYE